MKPRALFLILFAVLSAGGLFFIVRAKYGGRLVGEPSAAGRREQASPATAPATAPAAPGAVATADRLSEPEWAKAAIQQRLKAWASTGAEDEEERRLLLLEMKSILNGENAAALTRMLSTDELLGPFGLAALDCWLEAEPLVAARWLAQQAGVTAEQARYAANHLLKDPVLLSEYCARLPDTPWRQTFLAEASLLDVERNPTRAISLAQRMKPDAGQLNVLETVSYAWMVADLPAAMRWVETLQPGDARAHILAMGAKAVAVSDPDLAGSWLSSALLSEATRRETALSLVETWAHSDPRSAARWLAEELQGNVRQPAVLALARVWRKTDPAQAEVWIATLPEQTEIRELLAAEVAEANAPKE